MCPGKVEGDKLYYFDSVCFCPAVSCSEFTLSPPADMFLTLNIGNLVIAHHDIM